MLSIWTLLRRLIPVLGFLFWGTHFAFSWTIVRSETLSNVNGVSHVQRELQDASGSATVDLVTMNNRSHTLRIIDDPKDQLEMASALRTTGCLAGVNGGYFHPDRKPLGLLIVNGRKVHPYEKAKLLSGILFVRNGTVSIVRSVAYKSTAGITQALQAGPFLIEQSVPVPGLNATRSAARTAVIVGKHGEVAIVTSSAVTLDEFAHILSTPNLFSGGAPVRALNLDGGSSTGLWVRGDGHVYFKSPWKRVRNYIGIVRR